MKILYSKYTGSKRQGEFRDFDINSLGKGEIAKNELTGSIYSILSKYDIYEKTEAQSKYLTEEEIKKAPRFILKEKEI